MEIIKLLLLVLFIIAAVKFIFNGFCTLLRNFAFMRAIVWIGIIVGIFCRLVNYGLSWGSAAVAILCGIVSLYLWGYIADKK